MKTLERLSEYSFKAKHLALLRQLGEMKGTQKGLRGQPEILDTLRQVSLLESVEHSHHLDGVMASRPAIRKLVLKEVHPATPMERQVAGYTDALEIVVEPAAHMTLSVSLVRQLHAMLYGHLPHDGGRWRATNKDIVERNRHGSIKGILYRTVPATDIEMAMEATVSLFHGGLKRGVEPLLLISAAVLDFICIHPFSDGNGRISRLLMLLMLALSGHRVGEFVSIERVFAQNEEIHNDVLKQSVKGWHDGTHNPIPWIDFFLDILLTAYTEFQQRYTALSTDGARAPKTQLIRTAIGQSEGPFSVADICIQLPTVSRELVKKVIQQFRDEGLLEVKGKGRGSQWQRITDIG